MSKLNANTLIDQAKAQTGLDSPEGASYHEGLNALIEGINHSEKATERSYQMMSSLIVEALVNRLKVEDYVASHPEVLEQKIERPVFLFGMPRTGTTLCSHLLGSDPSRRSLLNWEAVDSIPPPTSETLKSDPRCVEKRAKQQAMLDANPDLVLPHWEYADDPTECIFVMGQDFKAWSWESRLPMPGYRDWLLNCDMTSAYEYHKKVLQVLQSKAPGIWNLKMPSHAIYLKALRKVFPDARLIWTHRDPFKTFASSCSLTKFSHQVSGITPDPEEIGSSNKIKMAAHINGCIAAKDVWGDDSIFDLHYAPTMKDPIGEMKRLYAWLGDDFTPQIEAGMQKWLADHPQNKHGKHSYQLEEFGVSVDSLMPIFGEYIERFQVKTSL